MKSLVSLKQCCSALRAYTLLPNHLTSYPSVRLAPWWFASTLVLYGQTWAMLCIARLHTATQLCDILLLAQARPMMICIYTSIVWSESLPRLLTHRFNCAVDTWRCSSVSHNFITRTTTVFHTIILDFWFLDIWLMISRTMHAISTHGTSKLITDLYWY